MALKGRFKRGLPTKAWSQVVWVLRGRTQCEPARAGLECASAARDQPRRLSHRGSGPYPPPSPTSTIDLTDNMIAELHRHLRFAALFGLTTLVLAPTSTNAFADDPPTDKEKPVAAQAKEGSEKATEKKDDPAPAKKADVKKDDAKKENNKKEDAKKEDAKKEDAKNQDARKNEADKKPVAAPVKSIFADEALEDAVRREVFAKRYNDEPITASDVAKISRVVGIDQKITSLEGLQHCKELMLIDLRDNAISDLSPIANLKRLQSVSLSDNKIRDIGPLKDLTSMQYLDLSGNKIADLSPVANMSNLRTLYAADNRLPDIAVVAKLPKLWSLDVAKNQIRDLRPVSGLSWLTTLEFSGNQVDSLKPVAGLTDLKMLLMSRNQVKDLSPLVDACRKDAESDRRFAPYLQVYLGGNPLDEKTLQNAKAELESFGVDVFVK
ncbi:Internalin-A precursor [Crateriforma conspicua]|nr:Internalin-A precursor [Crateriforma conspicua]